MTHRSTIMRSIEDDGPGTGSEIWAMLGLNPKNVIGHLMLLKKDGLVEVIGFVPTRTTKAAIYGKRERG